MNAIHVSWRRSRAARGCIQQAVELRLAADESFAQSADAPRTHQRERAHEPACRDSVRLSLRLDDQWIGELERTADRGSRSLADENLAGRGALLEPRGD